MVAPDAARIAFALVMTVLTGLVVLIQRDKGFPMSTARRGAATVLALDAALGWIAVGASAAMLDAPGWWMSIALMGAANLVCAFALLFRGFSLPTWLRVGSALVCLAAPLVLTGLVV